MIVFSLLSAGLDEEGTLLDIKSKLPGNYVTLEDIDNQDKNKNVDMVCRFSSKDLSENDENFGSVLNLMCSEGKQKFTVFFYRKLAKRMQEVLLQGRLSVGNFLLLKRPTIKIVQDNIENKSVKIKMGIVKSQSVVIWKSTSLYYIEPFFMQLTHVEGYRHIEFYNLDHTGSLEHAINNLCDLVAVHGPIKDMSQIANTGDKCVALASFTKKMTQLTEFRYTTDNSDRNVAVQLKFNEVLLESKPHTVTMFSAFFFAELASEIEMAVNTGSLQSGDLVAFIHPQFKKKTAAPINIEFPPHEKINFIVLKHQYSDGDRSIKVCVADLKLSPSDDLNQTEELHNDFQVNTPIEFFHCRSRDSACLEIRSKLKRYGPVSTIKQIFESSPQSLKKGLIVSYFLRLVRLEKDDKVSVFLKEIDSNNTSSVYFKLVLHQRFAKPFFSAIQNKNIAHGDLVCAMNPVVWENPSFILSSYKKDTSHLAEMAFPKVQKIVVFKLSKISETRQINLGSKQANLLARQDFNTDRIYNPDEQRYRDNHSGLPNLLSESVAELSITEQLRNPPDCCKIIGVEKCDTNYDILNKTETRDVFSNGCMKDASAIKSPITHEIPRQISKNVDVPRCGNVQNKNERIKRGHDNNFALDEVENGIISEEDDLTQFSCDNIEISPQRSNWSSLDTRCSGKSNEEFDQALIFTQPKEVCKQSQQNVNFTLTKSILQTEHSDKPSSPKRQCKSTHLFKKPEGIPKQRNTCATKEHHNMNCSVTGPKEHYRQNNISKRFNELDQNCNDILPEKQCDLNPKITKPVLNSKLSNLEEPHEQNDNSTNQNHDQSHKLITYEVNNCLLLRTVSEKDNSIQYQMVNPRLIPDYCFFKSNIPDSELKDNFPEYNSNFTLLPVCLTKPSLKYNIDLVSGFCKAGCKQMYPYTTTMENPNESSQRICPKCFKVLKLDFCLEFAAIGLGNLITILMHGTKAEKYLKVSCKTFLDNNDTFRESVTKLLKERLEHNLRSGKGTLIDTTDVTLWHHRS